MDRLVDDGQFRVSKFDTGANGAVTPLTSAFNGVDDADVLIHPRNAALAAENTGRSRPNRVPDIQMRPVHDTAGPKTKTRASNRLRAALKAAKRTNLRADTARGLFGLGAGVDDTTIACQTDAMLLRSILVLIVVAGISIALTMYFGHEVLLALGLILTQLQIIAKKLMTVELPSILSWLKTEASAFFRIEIFKKWFLSSILPLLIGNAVYKRLEKFVAQYRAGIAAQYTAMMIWYDKLEWYEKAVAALIILFATLGLTVSSLGLWLILFSVKLPLWLVATVSAFARIVVTSVRKMAFKAVAFFQLGWLWRILRRRLPHEYLERKRRFDFRVARRVVRRRRMTVRQLAASKDGLSMRLALIGAYFRTPRPEMPDPARKARLDRDRPNG